MSSSKSKKSDKLLSTIYRQNWPPPKKDKQSPENQRSDKRSPSSKYLAGNLWRGSVPFRSTTPLGVSRQRLKSKKTSSEHNTIKRPFSVNVERPKSAINYQENTKFKRISPEFTVEYVTMLSSKNYLRKMYREQYRSKDDLTEQKPPQSRALTPAQITIGSDFYKLYPDLGSVISRPSGRRSVLSSTSTPLYPRHNWKAKKKNTLNVGISYTSDNNKLDSGNTDSDSSVPTQKPNNGIAYASKSSWSNIPFGKSYRMQTQANQTLASISLEGRPPVVQKRNHLRSTSSSSFRSLLKGISASNRLSSAGESITSSPSLDSDNGAEEQSVVKPEKNVSIYFDDEEYERTKLLIDPSIYDQSIEDNENENIFSESNRTKEDETSSNTSCDDERYDIESMEGSDMSVLEFDGYQDEVLNKEEGERRLQQVSAIFSTQSSSSRKSSRSDNSQEAPKDLKSKLSDLSITDSNSDVDTEDGEQNDENKDEFCPLFPPPYNLCDIKLLASLPVDADWKSCVQLPAFLNSKHSYHDSSSNKKKHKSHSHRPKSGKSRKKSMERLKQRYKDSEAIMDRLIHMERLQEITVQYEKERKRHYQHIQRARSRNAKLRRSSSTLEGRPSSGTKSPSKQTSVHKELNRMLKTQSSTEESGKTETPRTENLLKPPTTPRRPISSYVRPWQQRCYEYSCSERIKDSRHSAVFHNLSFSKSRTCSSCREKSRKLNQLSSTQLIRSRSRSTSGTSITTSGTLNRNFANGSQQNLKFSTNTENREVIHGIPVETKSVQPASGRQTYPFGHAILKPPDGQNGSFNMQLASSNLNTVAREYSQAERANKRSLSVMKTRPRTTSIGSKRKLRTAKKVAVQNVEESLFLSTLK